MWYMPDTPHVNKLNLHFTLIEHLHNSMLKGNLKRNANILNQTFSFRIYFARNPMPFSLGFHTNNILNLWYIFFHSANVRSPTVSNMYSSFSILACSMESLCNFLKLMVQNQTFVEFLSIADAIDIFIKMNLHTLKFYNQ